MIKSFLIIMVLSLVIPSVSIGEPYLKKVSPNELGVIVKKNGDHDLSEERIKAIVHAAFREYKITPIEITPTQGDIWLEVTVTGDFKNKISGVYLIEAAFRTKVPEFGSVQTDSNWAVLDTNTTDGVIKFLKFLIKSPLDVYTFVNFYE